MKIDGSKEPCICQDVPNQERDDLVLLMITLVSSSKQHLHKHMQHSVAPNKSTDIKQNVMYESPLSPHCCHLVLVQSPPTIPIHTSHQSLKKPTIFQAIFKIFDRAGFEVTEVKRGPIVKEQDTEAEKKSKET